jgi:hypothetical protein
LWSKIPRTSSVDVARTSWSRSSLAPSNSRIYQATISTADGEIGVFPDHEPLVTVAAPGVITVRHNKEDDDK